MNRIALALAASIVGASGGCHHGDKPVGPKTTIIAKKIQLSWGLSPNGAGTDVYLQSTDETGAQIPHNLGTFPGQCAVTKVGAEMNALTAISCTGTDGVATELHVVIQNNENVVVLKLLTRKDVPPDPMAREELTSFKAPPGAAIESKPE